MVNTQYQLLDKTGCIMVFTMFMIFCFPPFSFISQPRARATSSITAVPDDGSAAPYVHASLWLPTITSRSKNNRSICVFRLKINQNYKPDQKTLCNLFVYSSLYGLFIYFSLPKNEHKSTVKWTFIGFWLKRNNFKQKCHYNDSVLPKHKW